MVRLNRLAAKGILILIVVGSGVCLGVVCVLLLLLSGIFLLLLSGILLLLSGVVSLGRIIIVLIKIGAGVFVVVFGCCDGPIFGDGTISMMNDFNFVLDNNGLIVRLVLIGLLISMLMFILFIACHFTEAD